LSVRRGETYDRATHSDDAAAATATRGAAAAAFGGFNNKSLSSAVGLPAVASCLLSIFESLAAAGAAWYAADGGAGGDGVGEGIGASPSLIADGGIADFTSLIIPTNRFATRGSIPPNNPPPLRLYLSLSSVPSGDAPEAGTTRPEGRIVSGLAPALEVTFALPPTVGAGATGGSSVAGLRPDLSSNDNTREVSSFSSVSGSVFGSSFEEPVVLLRACGLPEL